MGEAKRRKASGAAPREDYRYRGVKLHSGQSGIRLAVVRREIDEVVAISDLDSLVSWAKSVRHSPESRLLAGQKAISILENVGATRPKRRPQGLSPSTMRAITAGLDEESGWLNPFFQCSEFDNEADGAVRRETPMTHYGAGGKLRVGPDGH
jgi:hypothetical protein